MTIPPTAAQLLALNAHIDAGGTMPVRDLHMVTSDDCAAMLRAGWVIGIFPVMDLHGTGILSRITPAGREEAARLPVAD